MTGVLVSAAFAVIAGSVAGFYFLWSERRASEQTEAPRP